MKKNSKQEKKKKRDECEISVGGGKASFCSNRLYSEQV